MLLFPFAAAWLGWLIYSGRAAFVAGDVGTTLLLIAGGPITVIPLLLFAVGARRLSLTVIGFMQYVAPSLQFLVGIYFGEKLTQPLLVCFAFIWTAIAVFSIDAYLNRTRKPARVASVES